ncbi:hypothetical protein CA51_13350 [Rosistilla oblonga]|nr:hypothetical protein CA51_13350 [Rosistilla oblonga]
MKNTLSCPNCNHEIELTELMRTQVASQIRGELGAEATKLRRQLENQQNEVALQREALDKQRETLAEQIQLRVDEQRVSLLAEANQKAAAAVAVEIADRDAQLKELAETLDTARTNELELRKQQRQLQSEKESLKLEVARQLDDERNKIVEETKLQLDEAHQLRQAEKDKTIAEMAARLKELQRKVEQGSQQLQGEVQELALEDLLSTLFSADSIEPVAKGVHGGDAIQRVYDTSGLGCGEMLWESKRTKKWSNAWLAKARDDQRAARAGCVVIVTEVLPPGIRNFGLIDGVWVCNWPSVAGLATALRVGLVELGKSKLAVQGQNEKMELVYNYLAGREFQQRVEGVVEAFVTMQTDLESERRSMQRIWSKREKQLQRALLNTAGLYGDLQGIIGSSMPAIEGLATPAIEYSDVSVPQVSA